MEKAMVKNMFEKTGKNLEEWTELVRDKQFSKNGEIVNYLKMDYLLTHGYANLIARISRNTH